MKKHLKKQFSNWIMPLMVILITVVAYLITKEVLYAISYMIKAAALTIGLYIYGALSAYEAERETRLEYEPEEPEV